MSTLSPAAHRRRRLLAWPAALLAPIGALSPVLTARAQGAEPEGLDPLLARIDAFGFDSRMKMGLGGMLAVEVYPVVLFKNGEALLNVRALGQPAALAEHQQSHPKEWTRWQRSGGKLQLMRSEGWKAMAFQTTTQRLPDNTRLNGRYRLLGGAGNSSQSVATWAEWQFSADGRFQRSGGAGGRTETSGGSLATASQASPQTGRYRIDGLQIHLQHDGGRSERMLILMDLNDPKSALWLNGQAHARQKD